MKLLLVACAVLLSGCAGLRGSTSTPWPWAQGAPERPVCKDMGNCRSDDALHAYMSASDYCRRLHAYYESGGRKNEGFQFGVGAAGAVAGSLIAPIAKGTAAKAWSGLSGAANAVQLSMEEAFSTSVAVRRSLKVKSAADAGAEAFTKAGNPYAAVLVAVEMARACSMAATDADAEALEALRSVR